MLFLEAREETEYTYTRIPTVIKERPQEEHEIPLYFNDLIKNLPQWKRDLIKEYKQVTTKQETIDTLNSSETIYLVSDGGEDKSLGYFRWVIGTYTTIIVQHNGHTTGNHKLIELLRTESVGVLSLVT